MKLRYFITGGLALGAGLLATISFLPNARAELVYDNSAPPAPSQVNAVDDREVLRQALNSSEKAQATLQAQQAVQPPSRVITSNIPLTAPVMQVAAPSAVIPAAVVPTAQLASTAVAASTTPGQTDDVQNLSKSELLRRERMRDELKNEDLLQERLEELRLKEEERLTDRILGTPAASDPETEVPTAAPVPQNQVQNQVVTAPVTEGGPAIPEPTAPSTGVMVASALPMGAGTPMLQTQAQLSSLSPDAEANKVSFMLEPRIGISNMVGTTAYQIMPRYAASLGLGLGLSKYINLEAAYTYSEFGIGLNSSNPFVQQMAAYMSGMNPNFNTLTLRQNLFEGDAKIYLLGPDSTFRPFIAGGGAYSLGLINYNSAIVGALNQYGAAAMSQDYNLTSFLGVLSAGFDVQINKSISIGATFKYYAVLSSNENQNLNNMAFYGGPAGYASSMYANADKEYVGGTLAQTGFYTLLAGVNYTF